MHSELVKMARYRGAGSSAEDIVQEFYLKAHKYLEQGKQLNRAYCFSMIGCLVVDKVHRKTSLEELTADVPEIEDEGAESAMEKQFEIMESVMQESHWYNRQVIQILLSEGISVSELSRRTQIDVHSLYRTIRGFKSKCNEKFERSRRLGGRSDQSNWN